MLPDVLEASAARFVASEHFGQRGDLAERFAAFLGSNDAPPVWADRVRLEAWLLAPPLLDLEAERFGAIPDPEAEAPGRLRPSTTLRIGEFTRDAVVSVIDWPPEGPTTVKLAAALFGGSPRAVELAPQTEAELDAAKDGRIAGREIADALLEAGLLVWLPAPR